MLESMSLQLPPPQKEKQTAFSKAECWGVGGEESPLLLIFLRSWLLSSLGYLRKCGFPHPNQPVL